MSIGPALYTKRTAIASVFVCVGISLISLCVSVYIYISLYILPNVPIVSRKGRTGKSIEKSIEKRKEKRGEKKEK